MDIAPTQKKICRLAKRKMIIGKSTMSSTLCDVREEKTRKRFSFQQMLLLLLLSNITKVQYSFTGYQSRQTTQLQTCKRLDTSEYFHGEELQQLTTDVHRCANTLVHTSIDQAYDLRDRIQNDPFTMKIENQQNLPKNGMDFTKC